MFIPFHVVKMLKFWGVSDCVLIYQVQQIRKTFKLKEKPYFLARPNVFRYPPLWTNILFELVLKNMFLLFSIFNAFRLKHVISALTS